MFLGSYGHLFGENLLKKAKFSISSPLTRKAIVMHIFTKKVAVAAKKRVKNTFWSRERVQRALLSPRLTWFGVEICSFSQLTGGS